MSPGITRPRAGSDGDEGAGLTIPPPAVGFAGRMPRMRSRIALLLGITLLGVLVVGGVTIANAASSSSSVKVCVTGKNLVREASSRNTCPKGTRQRTVNVRGPQGPPGLPGAPGAKGDPGAAATNPPMPDVIDGGTP